MKVLGINAFHGDSSACVFVDGQLLAAVEEERFNRIKHWAGFPAQAIRSCLEEGGLTLGDVDLIGVNRAPGAHVLRKLWHLASRRPSPGMVLDRFRKGRRLFNLEREFQKSFEIRNGNLGGRLRRVEHHLAHLASAFLVSPFDRAAVLSVDAMGDFSSLATGIGEGTQIRVLRRVYFPHSLGIFYTAVTQFLGFPRYGTSTRSWDSPPTGSRGSETR